MQNIQQFMIVTEDTHSENQGLLVIGQNLRGTSNLREVAVSVASWHVDIVCFSEVRATAVAKLRSTLKEYTLFSSVGSATGSKLGSCIGLINELRHNVIAQLQAPEDLDGRLTGLLMQEKCGDKMLICSAYLPSALDGLPEWARQAAVKEFHARRHAAGDENEADRRPNVDAAATNPPVQESPKQNDSSLQTARMACKIYACILDWQEATGCQHVLVMGDINETYLEGDRLHRSEHGMRARSALISSCLIPHGYVDLYELHAAERIGDSRARFTFWSPDGKSASRIDVAFGLGLHSLVTDCEHMRKMSNILDHHPVAIRMSRHAFDNSLYFKMRFARKPRIRNWRQDDWQKFADRATRICQEDQTLMNSLSMLELREYGRAFSEGRAAIERCELRMVANIKQALSELAGWTRGQPFIDPEMRRLRSARKLLIAAKNIAQEMQRDECDDMKQRKAYWRRLRGRLKRAAKQGLLEVPNEAASVDQTLEKVVYALRETRKKIRQTATRSLTEMQQRHMQSSSMSRIQSIMVDRGSAPLLALLTDNKSLTSTPQQLITKLHDHYAGIFAKTGQDSLPQAIPVTLRVDENDEIEQETLIVNDDWKATFFAKKNCVAKDAYNGLMSAITVAEVCKKAFPTRIVAAGADGLSGGIIGKAVRLSPTLAKMVTVFFTACIRLSYMPEAGRFSEIVPIIKSSAKPASLDNLRPISLQSGLMKGLQKVLAVRLGDALVKNNILHQAQEGFLPRHGCHRAVEWLRNVWRSARRSKKSCLNIFYDISAAYDNARHVDIIQSLRRISLPESFIRYIKSGISENYSCVRTVFGVSERFPVLRSVRQGDPLAPLLFAILMDSLHTVLHEAEQGKNGFLLRLPHAGRAIEQRICSIGYADDIVIIARGHIPLLKMHRIVAAFCAIFGLKLNALKSVAIGVDQSARKLDLHIGYSANDSALCNDACDLERDPDASDSEIEDENSADGMQRNRGINAKQRKGQRRKKVGTLARGSELRAIDRSFALCNGNELAAHGPDFAVKYLGVPMSMDFNPHLAPTQLEKIINAHAAIATSHRLSFALCGLMQQQWTVNTIEHCVRFLSTSSSERHLQALQTRALRACGRLRNGRPIKEALHLLAGVSQIQNRRIAANLADFMLSANGDDAVARVVRHELLAEQSSQQVQFAMASLCQRATAAAKIISWEVRAKHTLVDEYVRLSRPIRLMRANGDGEIRTSSRKRKQATVSMALQHLMEMELQVFNEYPDPRKWGTVSKSVKIDGHIFELAFGGFAGLYKSAAGDRNPTSCNRRLKLFTDGAWIDIGHSADPATEPGKPIGAYGICVADDAFLHGYPQIADEDNQSVNLETQAKCHGFILHHGAVSGWHSSRAYAAELLAIVVAIACCPIDWHLEICSDSSSALEAIESFRQLSSVRRKFGESCHPFLFAVNWMMKQKRIHSGSVKFVKVASHTAGVEVDAVGNRMADMACGIRLRELRRIFPQYLDEQLATNERDDMILRWDDARYAAASLPFVFYQHTRHRHVLIEPVRSEVRMRERCALLRAWMQNANQSTYMRPKELPVMRSLLNSVRDSPFCSSFVILCLTDCVQWGSRSCLMDEQAALDPANEAESRPWNAQLCCRVCDDHHPMTFQAMMTTCQNARLLEARRALVLQLAESLGLDPPPESTSNDVIHALHTMFGKEIWPMAAIGCFGSDAVNQLIALRGSESADAARSIKQALPKAQLACAKCAFALYEVARQECDMAGPDGQPDPRDVAASTHSADESEWQMDDSDSCAEIRLTPPPLTMVIDESKYDPPQEGAAAEIAVDALAGVNARADCLSDAAASPGLDDWVM
jgi:hypothetical protein